MYMMGLYELEFFFTSFNKKLQSRKMYHKYVKCIGGVLCSNLVDLDRGFYPRLCQTSEIGICCFSAN